MNKIKSKIRTIENILLFGIFPLILLFIALRAKWVAFGIALAIYAAVFIYFKLENIYLIITGFNDKKGEYTKASVYAHKAYKLKHSSVDTASIFVYMLLKAGRYENALDICAKNTDREMTENQYIGFHSNWALALWKAGNINGAVEKFDKIANKYESTSIYVSYGTILTYSKDLNKALEFNKKAYEYNSASKGIIDNLAYTYFLIGDIDKAQNMYDDLLRDTVSFPEAYHNGALVAHAKGQYEEAVRLLKRALSKPFNGLSAVTKQEIQKKIDHLNRGQGGIL